MDRGDARVELFGDPDKTATYLHRPPSQKDGFDYVTGPIPVTSLANWPKDTNHGLEEKHSITRFHLIELPDAIELTKAARWYAYENVEPTADVGIASQRRRVDASLRVFDITTAEVPPQLVDKAIGEIRSGISALFRHALCSMTRIVISLRFREHPDWIISTIRDEQKSASIDPDVALLRMSDDGTLLAYCARGKRPSSSAVSLWHYHRLAPPGALVHAHLLAPVLLDAEFEGMRILNEQPRSPAFGGELATTLNSGAYAVLRRGEGIWAAGDSVANAAGHAFRCQMESHRRLWDARAKPTAPMSVQ
jgi:hypothetical protein